MLNVTNSDIEKSVITSIDGTIFYDIILVRKPMFCPYCDANAYYLLKKWSHLLTD